MESFLKKAASGKYDDDVHKYFIRFGKGDYGRRFLLSFDQGKKVKIKASFELANDLVAFLNEIGKFKFTGKILLKEKLVGKEAKKKGGVYLYEISNEAIEGYPNAYYYLLNTANEGAVLKIKGSLPKPGKSELKIDDKFCVMELDQKYWPDVKKAFFWDVPDGKKAIIEHEIKINEIVFPKGEKDPVKIRELAKRKGTIVRKMNLDGKESVKEYPFEA